MGFFLPVPVPVVLAPINFPLFLAELQWIRKSQSAGRKRMYPMGVSEESTEGVQEEGVKIPILECAYFMDGPQQNKVFWHIQSAMITVANTVRY